MTPAIVWHLSPRMPLSLNQRARQMAELDLKTSFTPPPPHPSGGAAVSQKTRLSFTPTWCHCVAARVEVSQEMKSQFLFLRRQQKKAHNK